MNLISKFNLPLPPFNKEFAGLLIIILIFLLFPQIVRHVDITSAPIDPGAFSAVILAIAAMLFFKAVTWWLIKAIWPVFAEYSDLHFERNFKSLLSMHKVIIYLGFYLAILYGFVFVLVAIL